MEQISSQREGGVWTKHHSSAIRMSDNDDEPFYRCFKTFYVLHRSDDLFPLSKFANAETGLKILRTAHVKKHLATSLG